MHTLAHAASRRSGSGPGMAPGRRPGTVSQDDDGESGGRFPTKPSGGWVSESDDEAAPPADPVVRKRVTRVTRGDGGAYWYRRVAYVTDSYLSQSVYQSYALIAGAVALTVSGGFGYHGIDDTVGYLDGMWATFTWISTGILSSGVVPSTIASRAVASSIVIVGILYFSVVLALVVEAVQFKMKSLREGKSEVVEKGHVVMLGWSEKSLLFIKEIVLANESEGGGAVVVLCQDGKEKMERELNVMLPKSELKGTSVVFRQGSRLMVGDLCKVSVHTARSVVVFSNGTKDADKADAEVLQVVLNLSNLSLAGHVVAEVRDKDNEPLIHLIGRGNVETVVSHDVIGRLMLMSVRQPGLAEVYRVVLGFDGDEFYSAHWKELNGVVFGETHLMLPDAIPIGVKSKDGGLELNPRHDRVMGPQDELVVLAEDNDTYRPKTKHVPNPGRVPWIKGSDTEREFILFAGWRRDLRDVLLLLDAMCVGGSEIHIMASVALSDRDRLLADGGLEVETLRNIKLVHHVGNTAQRRHLELLNIGQFTSVIVFADETEEGDIMQSDSKCLATLLLIRNIQKAKRAELRRVESLRRNNNVRRVSSGGTDQYVKTEFPRIPIVTEILDPRTQQTIQSNDEMRAVSDFLQSNDMVSKIMAMVCEDRSVKEILDEMLAPRGASMACVPASRYAKPGEKLSFYDMAVRCQEYGEILIGFLEEDPERVTDGHGATQFKPPQINPTNKTSAFAWDAHVCCLLTGGPAVDHVMKSKAKFVDTSFARKMGLGLTSVLEVGEDDFVKLVATAFKRFDDDKSGALELNEILEAFRTLPLKCTEKQVVTKFREFDVDDSNALDQNEFEALMRSLREEQVLVKFADVGEAEFDEMCERSFVKFDEDSSGELDLPEIIRAFQKLPLREMTEDEVRALFTKFDFDSSGALDRDEFRDLMRALRKENAKKAKVARPRMDQVERRNVRDVAAMAEVRLGKLPPKERDVAMASIMCFVNEGRFEQTPPVRTWGGSHGADDVRTGGRHGRASSDSHGVDADAHRAPYDRQTLTPSGISVGVEVRTPGLRSPALKRGGDVHGDIDISRKMFPPMHSTPSHSVEDTRPGTVTGTGLVSKDTLNESPDASTDASYVTDRIARLPAARRNQVIQVVDLLFDSFANGTTVPATTLLGLISSSRNSVNSRNGGAIGAAPPVSAFARARALGRPNSTSRRLSPTEEPGDGQRRAPTVVRDGVDTRDTRDGN